MVRNYKKLTFALSGVLAFALSGIVMTQDAEAQAKKQTQVKQNNIGTLGNVGGSGGSKDEKGVPYGTPTFSQNPGAKLNLLLRHEAIGGDNFQYKLIELGAQKYLTVKAGMNCGPNKQLQELNVSVNDGGVYPVNVPNGASKVNASVTIEPYKSSELSNVAITAMGSPWSGDLPKNRVKQKTSFLSKNVVVYGKCGADPIKQVTYKLTFNPVKVIDTDYPY
ncbi:MAG: hypothetical protein MI743_10405 [Sneathiellales bacterium]|nr:hypothetical protein [Sneathiellales bacterium]